MIKQYAKPTAKVVSAALLGGVFLSATSASAGSIARHFYDDPNIGASPVQALRDAPSFPDSPSFREELDDYTLDVNNAAVFGFQGQENAGDNYGSRARGYVQIPMDGDYTFHISSDDASELWLSPDINASNAELIAEETGCCAPLFGGDRLAARTHRVTGLTKGSIHYIEALQVEGGGGAYVQVGWTKPDGTQEIIPARHLMQYYEDPGDPFSGIPARSGNSAPVFNPNSANGGAGGLRQVTITEGQPLTLDVDVFGNQPISFKWFIDGEEQDGEILGYWMSDNIPLSLNGSTVKVEVTNSLGTISSETTLFVNQDNESPTVLSAVASGLPYGVIVTYSEPVDESSATDIGNYSATGGITIGAASMLANNRVLLETSLWTGTDYDLTISGVTDRAQSPNAVASTTVTISKFVNGLTYLFYDTGSHWNTFYTDGRGQGNYPPGAAPFGANGVNADRLSGTIPYFENPHTGDINTAPPGDIQNSYTQVVFGYISPQVSGTYHFYLATDDNSELYLSTDSDPANAVLIANEPEWNGVRDYNGTPGNVNWSTTTFPNGFQLNAGEYYYVEAIMQEGGGGDNLAVAWDTAGITPDNGAAPISGEFLFSSFDTGELSIVTQPQSQLIEELRTATFSVEATGSESLAIQYQWYLNDVVIPGANQSSYTTLPNTIANDGDEYKVMVVNRDGTYAPVWSDVAVLNVDNDVNAPKIVSVNGSPLMNTLTVVFDEAVTQDTAEDVSNYAVTAVEGGAALAVTGATLLGDGMSVMLDTAMQADGIRYNLEVSGITDVSAAANELTGDVNFWSYKNQAGGLTVLIYEYAGGGLDGFYPDAFTRGKGNYPDNYNPFGPNITDRTSGTTPYFEYPYHPSRDPNNAPAADFMNNYAQIVFGHIVPEQSGTYRFFLATDDNSELWLSTDENPANSVLIANEPEWNGVRDYNGTPDNVNQSLPIELVAGERYYVEVAMQEGGGGDNLAVAWTMTTDGSEPAGVANGANPIGGKYLWSNLPVFDEVVLESIFPLDGSTLVSPTGAITVQLKNGASRSVVEDSVVLDLNGMEVTPEVSVDGDNVTISYTPAGLDPDTQYTAVLRAQDSEGGELSWSWSFSTHFLVAGTRFIESEDWNYDGGQWIEGANGGPTGEPYTGGAYADLIGVPGVDYNEIGNQGDSNLYRTTDDPNSSMAAFGGNNANRGTFFVETNYKIGWTDEGDWYNYTRDFPEDPTEYEVYAHLSSGGADPNGTLQLVTSDPSQPDQTVEQLGAFSGAASGDWGTAIFYKMHQIGDPGTVATVTLSGVNTIRFTRGAGAMDMDALMFVPLSTEVEAPMLSASYAGGVLTLTWEGTLQSADTIGGGFSDVAEAAGQTSLEVTPDGMMKFYRAVR
jgi:hypothetical protein